MTAETVALQPGLAVVIPVHNRPDLLRRAIDSVLDQWMTGVWVVVVDDGSEPPVETNFGHPAVSVVRVDHGGVSAARNAGIDAAKATYVSFLDSDDELRPGWIREVMEAIADGVALWSCPASYEWADGSSMLASPVPIVHTAGAPSALFLAGAFVVRRDVVLEAGGYRVGLRHGENTDLGWRVSELIQVPDNVVVASRPLLTVHAQRKTISPDVRLESALTMVTDPPALLRNHRPTFALYHAIAGVAASQLGKRRQAVRLLFTAVRLNPREPRHLARLLRALLSRNHA